MTQQDTLQNAQDLAQRLREIIAETQSDMGRMPVFVRPMAKRGFAKRTGRTLSEWEAFASEMIAHLQAGLERASSMSPDTLRSLERLRQNYQTAPERAGRFMRDETTRRMLTERSREREKVVADTMAALRELGVR